MVEKIATKGNLATFIKIANAFTFLFCFHQFYLHNMPIKVRMTKNSLNAGYWLNKM
jgi:hypothetical protein